MGRLGPSFAVLPPHCVILIVEGTSKERDNAKQAAGASPVACFLQRNSSRLKRI